jgi:hypothetical protein
MQKKGHPPVKKIMLAISLVFWLGAAAQAQEQTPQLLFRAAQCLAVKNFLPSPKTTTGLDFGYFLDENSYPGDKVIYVVMYAASARTNGLVFVILSTKRGDLQNFNIQNNASFVFSKAEADGVAFKDPPLGGAWTQEHIASAVKQIEKQPRFTIAAKDLSVADPSVLCESYTDPQPRKK